MDRPRPRGRLPVGAQMPMEVPTTPPDPQIGSIPYLFGPDRHFFGRPKALCQKVTPLTGPPRHLTGVGES